MKVASARPVSVGPWLVTYWQAVEDVTTELPLGHELIHQRHEAGVVGWLQQVDHLMDHDVFEALARLLGEVGVQTDTPLTRFSG